MLPIISETMRERVVEDSAVNPKDWIREQIHLLKEQNPEVNTLLLGLAQDAKDPQAVMLAGYSIYQMLEAAFEEENQSLNAF